MNTTLLKACVERDHSTIMNGDASLQREEHQQRSQHTSFVESLERHASGNSNGGVSRAVWASMATDLDWTVEQVQIYAYRYMMALNNNDDNREDSQHRPQEKGDSGDVIMNDGANERSINSGNNENDVTSASPDTEWTLEEDILLDSLLAVYLPRENNRSTSSALSNNDGILDWEEQIASRLPRRTPIQVRQRYNTLYNGNRGDR